MPPKSVCVQSMLLSNPCCVVSGIYVFVHMWCWLGFLIYILAQASRLAHDLQKEFVHLSSGVFDGFVRWRITEEF